MAGVCKRHPGGVPAVVRGDVRSPAELCRLLLLGPQCRTLPYAVRPFKARVVLWSHSPGRLTAGFLAVDSVHALFAVREPGRVAEALSRVRLGPLEWGLVRPVLLLVGIEVAHLYIASLPGIGACNGLLRQPIALAAFAAFTGWRRGDGGPSVRRSHGPCSRLRSVPFSVGQPRATGGRVRRSSPSCRLLSAQLRFRGLLPTPERLAQLSEQIDPPARAVFATTTAHSGSLHAPPCSQRPA